MSGNLGDIFPQKKVRRFGPPSPNYNAFFSCREDGHGGAALFVHNSLDCNLIAIHAQAPLNGSTSFGKFCFNTLEVFSSLSSSILFPTLSPSSLLSDAISPNEMLSTSLHNGPG